MGPCPIRILLWVGFKMLHIVRTPITLQNRYTNKLEARLEIYISWSSEKPILILQRTIRCSPSIYSTTPFVFISPRPWLVRLQTPIDTCWWLPSRYHLLCVVFDFEFTRRAEHILFASKRMRFLAEWGNDMHLPGGINADITIDKETAIIIAEINGGQRGQRGRLHRGH